MHNELQSMAGRLNAWLADSALPLWWLWPQTERLKAALMFAEDSDSPARLDYRAHALAACQSLLRYLDTPMAGLWRDTLLPDNCFVEEPAPASSFYHIICAVSALAHAANG
jgi:mannose-6-phosphate isomerase